MASKTILDKLSLYVSQDKQKEKIIQRLIALGENRDRTLNYLAFEAILEYLKREEVK